MKNRVSPKPWPPIFASRLWWGLNAWDATVSRRFRLLAPALLRGLCISLQAWYRVCVSAQKSLVSTAFWWAATAEDTCTCTSTYAGGAFNSARSVRRLAVFQKWFLPSPSQLGASQLRVSRFAHHSDCWYRGQVSTRTVDCVHNGFIQTFHLKPGSNSNW
jgi:hypothetical protein